MASGEEPVRVRLENWLQGVMRRLEPDQIRIPSGGTLGDAVAAVLTEEELAARASGENDLRGAKLELVQKLRQQFQVGGEARPEPPALGDEASYELVMGGLDAVPLARLADILELWQRIVEGVGSDAGLAAAERALYRRVPLDLSENAGEKELAATFRGTHEMVRQLRRYLQEAGIEEGPA